MMTDYCCDKCLVQNDCPKIVERCEKIRSPDFYCGDCQECNDFKAPSEFKSADKLMRKRKWFK